jgi:hypothetical protein
MSLDGVMSRRFTVPQVEREPDLPFPYLDRANGGDFVASFIVYSHMEVGPLLKGCDLDLNAHPASIGPRLDTERTYARFVGRYLCLIRFVRPHFPIRDQIVPYRNA